MVGRITQRIDTAFISVAWIFTGLRLKVAESPVRAIVVRLALWFGSQNAVALSCEFVAVIFWADTASTLVDDETAFEGADTMTRLVDLKPTMDLADDALLVDIEGSSRWADASSVVVGDSIRWTESALVALDGGVALIARKTLADHRSHWQRVENLADGVDATRLGGIAWVDALAGDASCLRLTVAVVVAHRVVDDTTSLRV